MAEMSVHQTRAYFKRTLGEIVDRPEVGRQLTEVRARRFDAMIDLREHALQTCMAAVSQRLLNFRLDRRCVLLIPRDTFALPETVRTVSRSVHQQ
jgi:hypothetical protein